MRISNPAVSNGTAPVDSVLAREQTIVGSLVLSHCAVVLFDMLEKLYAVGDNSEVDRTALLRVVKEYVGTTEGVVVLVRRKIVVEEVMNNTVAVVSREATMN